MSHLMNKKRKYDELAQDFDFIFKQDDLFKFKFSHFDIIANNFIKKSNQKYLHNDMFKQELTKIENERLHEMLLLSEEPCLIDLDKLSSKKDFNKINHVPLLQVHCLVTLFEKCDFTKIMNNIKLKFRQKPISDYINSAVKYKTKNQVNIDNNINIFDKLLFYFLKNCLDDYNFIFDFFQDIELLKLGVFLKNNIIIFIYIYKLILNTKSFSLKREGENMYDLVKFKFDYESIIVIGSLYYLKEKRFFDMKGLEIDCIKFLKIKGIDVNFNLNMFNITTKSNIFKSSLNTISLFSELISLNCINKSLLEKCLLIPWKQFFNYKELITSQISEAIFTFITDYSSNIVFCENEIYLVKLNLLIPANNIIILFENLKILDVKDRISSFISMCDLDVKSLLFNFLYMYYTEGDIHYLLFHSDLTNPLFTKLDGYYYDIVDKWNEYFGNISIKNLNPLYLFSYLEYSDDSDHLLEEISFTTKNFRNILPYMKKFNKILFIKPYKCYLIKVLSYLEVCYFFIKNINPDYYSNTFLFEDYFFCQKYLKYCFYSKINCKINYIKNEKIKKSNLYRILSSAKL